MGSVFAKPLKIPSFSEYFKFIRSKNQIPELDGLRGLAIILVVFRHSYLPYKKSAEPVFSIFGWDLGTFLANGWIGVDLFFVLSGFLIAFHIMRLGETVKGRWPWKSYLAKRVLRIVPAYYAALALVVMGAFPFFNFPQGNMGFRIGYHLLFLQDYFPANFIVAFWSLGVEEKFYIIAPFIVLGIVRITGANRKILALIGLLLLGILFRILTALKNPEIHSYVPFFFVFRSPFHVTLDPLLMGVILAFIYKARDQWARLKTKNLPQIAFWAGFALFLALTLSGKMMATITVWDKTLQPTAIAFGFFLMTFGLLFGGGFKSIFRSAVLFFFARISYSLYLVHLGLSPLAMAVARNWFSLQPTWIEFFPVFLFVTVLASLLLHWGVEKPFLILKGRLA